MLRTVIIDDEAHMRQALEKLIKQSCPKVRIIGKADSVKTGIEIITKLHPGLVLLDIRMDDETGFNINP